MKIRVAVLLLFLVFVLTGVGCAYRYYLGMHGPSIKLHPDDHMDVSEDSECLECHHPDRDPEGPPTTHPQFKGCLKCHNDNV